ncbi:YceI family protein [Altericroceibacterium endophyticum]|uniref:YceI family protein n=1 Tax=Altericroceibacterium endophyticum TaxID=1808508 RepID=A0A6I4T3T0_9SPHN|nr:YceI family protein [Altericroceibacterium endophyticum]MXO64195.1 YceI family protein [Altericroceibacterium endophyticum]
MKPHSRIFLPSVLALSLVPLAACSGGAEQEPAPLDGSWTLQNDQSRLSFMSVKNGAIIESHKFTDLSGTVSDSGVAEVTIDLGSVATNIDARDQRMRDILFQVDQFPDAVVTAQIDPAQFKALKPGESQTETIPAALDLHGTKADLNADVEVTRIGDDTVRVETVTPIMVNAADFSLDQGIEQLREVAGLDAITGNVPVSFVLTYTR